MPRASSSTSMPVFMMSSLADRLFSASSWARGGGTQFLVCSCLPQPCSPPRCRSSQCCPWQTGPSWRAAGQGGRRIPWSALFSPGLVFHHASDLLDHPHHATGLLIVLHLLANLVVGLGLLQHVGQLPGLHQHAPSSDSRFSFSLSSRTSLSAS